MHKSLEIFKSKNTDRLIIVLSLAPILVHIFLDKGNALDFSLLWIAAGLFAWIISDMFEEHHLGVLGRNHAFSISWALISLMLNFAMVNFNEYEMSLDIERWLFVDSYLCKYLIQMAGFITILSLVMHSWQIKIAPIYYLGSGLIVGFVSILFEYTLFWLLLFPLFFYHMRTASKQNYGSVITGTVFALWVSYILIFLFGGETRADAFILSYGSIFDNIFPDIVNYIWYEWIFIAFTVLLLIIYSISGFAINVAKTVKAHACVIMLSTISLLIAVFAVIDYSHLPNYIGILSILLSFQIALHQSCVVSIKNEWWTIMIILLYICLSVLPSVLPLIL